MLKIVFIFNLLLWSFFQTESRPINKWDVFLKPFRKSQRLLQVSILHNKEIKISSHAAKKMQPVIPHSIPFPCDVKKGRQSKKPQSIHKLKPGDIDVVGAIGDSITAGNGLTAINILDVLLEERGKSSFIGGKDNWRKYLTLPNILKVFNPNLIGYSLNTSSFSDIGSQFNVARLGAHSADVPNMARDLIHKMKLDKRVNIHQDWKMITIYIGSNDICSTMCYWKTPETGLKQHKSDLIEALRLLRDNLPRTMVNIIPLPHFRLLVDLKQKPLQCHLFQAYECPCLFGSQFKHKRNFLYDLNILWQNIDVEMAQYSEFDLDDFTVVVQPFTTNFTFPAAPGGVYDPSFFSEDCFHFSQKMDAKVANDLWNNIMEPVGYKSLDGNDFFKKFICPTEEHPYIFTQRNSMNLQ